MNINLCLRAVQSKKLCGTLRLLRLVNKLRRYVYRVLFHDAKWRRCVYLLLPTPNYPLCAWVDAACQDAGPSFSNKHCFCAESTFIKLSSHWLRLKLSLCYMWLIVEKNGLKLIQSTLTSLRACLHQASASTLRQLCNDASNSVLTENNGITQKMGCNPNLEWFYCFENSITSLIIECS